MATLTLHNVDDDLVAGLHRAADRGGRTAEAEAIDRLSVSLSAEREHRDHEAWVESLLMRLRSGESTDGPLGEELRRWREPPGVRQPGDSLAAMIRDAREGRE